MLSSDGLRKLARCVEEARRGRASSKSIAEDLLARLGDKGLRVEESEPDLAAMAATLAEAGYTVEAPVVA